MTGFRFVSNTCFKISPYFSDFKLVIVFRYKVIINLLLTTDLTDFHGSFTDERSSAD